MQAGPDVLAVVVPRVERGRQSVGLVIKEIRTAAPDVTVIVVDDGSSEGRHRGGGPQRRGRWSCTNVFNLGVGGAMRVGIRYALAHGYRARAVQLDGDGQHDPRDVPALLEPPSTPTGPPQVVIGARFAGRRRRVGAAGASAGHARCWPATCHA